MITSVSQEVTSRKRVKVTPLDIAYKQLNEYVDKINDKIVNRLQLVQHVFLDDYKEQFNTMTQELQKLRQNLDKQILRQKSNERIFMLQEERDFFRQQVRKLNDEVNQLRQINNQLKKQNFDTSNELISYQTVAFNLQKKLQKLQQQQKQLRAFKRESSVPVLPLAVQTIEVKNRPISSRDETKQVTQRIKTYSKRQSATRVSMKRYEQYSDRDRILDQCIKELKKEIYLRKNEDKNQQILFDQFNKVSFDKFTRTDKKHLVYKLLTSQKLLQEFGEFINSKNQGASRIVRTKIGDNNFNEKYLSDLKRSFSRKIFSLKASQNSLAEATQRRKFDQF